MVESSSDIGPDAVEVTENMGEWFVRVVRSGKSSVSTFEIEAYARAYADGQRLGLNLGKDNNRLARPSFPYTLSSA